MNLREGLHIVETAHNTGLLNAIDLVEVNPKIGSKRQVMQTVEAGIHVSKAAFGHCRGGVVPAHVKNLPGFYAPHDNAGQETPSKKNPKLKTLISYTKQIFFLQL